MNPNFDRNSQIPQTLSINQLNYACNSKGTLLAKSVKLVSNYLN